MRRLRLLCWAAAPYAWDGWVRTPSTADQAPTWALAQGAERGAREWHEAGGAGKGSAGEVVPVRVVPTKAMPTREVQPRAVPTRVAPGSVVLVLAVAQRSEHQRRELQTRRQRVSEAGVSGQRGAG
jgi:hypothetical protein